MKAAYLFANRFLSILCVAIFAALVLTTTWQVFSRLVLNSPVTWSEELAKMLFVWLSFLGLAYVYGERGHMAVEFLARRFDESKERIFALWTHAVSFIFGVLVLLWGGINASINAWTQNLTALPVNIGSVYLVMPIAGAAIALYAVYHFIEVAEGKESNYPVPEADMAMEDVERLQAGAEAEAKKHGSLTLEHAENGEKGAGK